MRAKTSFIVHVNGRPIGRVPEGALFERKHRVVRQFREHFEPEKKAST